jgi:hypothetical protein
MIHVEFTVMRSNLAELKEAEFKNLRVPPVVGRAHSAACAVRRNWLELLAALGEWVED